MKSAVTVCVVPEAARGPFVFHGSLADGCRAAADLGFDAIELFAADAGDLSTATTRDLLATHGLELAAVGTGAGWVRHGWSLCHADPANRALARDFIGGIIDAAGELGAPAIVGSMQGRSGGDVSREAALDLLADALHDLGRRAARHGRPVLYEPLNRYETDLVNRQGEAAAFLRSRGIGNVRLLCDLFHMNIEEADVAAALAAAGDLVGHVHWADSNRRAVGLGHTDPRPIAAALRAIGFSGFLSAEVLPLPTPLEAARRSITACREFATT